MKTLLLALALFFVPAVRADVVNFSFGNGDWIWTLQQGAAPDVGSVAAGDFTFSLVPVQTFAGVHTFDLHFFRLDGRTDFVMTCDPFGFNIEHPELTCDYFNRVEIDGLTAIWAAGSGGSPNFLAGNYNGLVIGTPEPSALVLVLGALALASIRRHGKGLGCEFRKSSRGRRVHFRLV